MGEPLCARCAKERKTCCQIYEIYVSPGDKRRIAEHTGRRDFYRFGVASAEDRHDEGDTPWETLVFRPDGSRRILEREEGGDCTFLGATGCTLPLEVRPLICRVYPYDYDYRGIREKLCTGCPTHLLGRGETLLLALDMRREPAVRWHEQLYRELEEETTDEDRADLRPQE